MGGIKIWFDFRKFHKYHIPAASPMVKSKHTSAARRRVLRALLSGTVS